ncbi:MAG: hypothetical protein KC550_04915, partial [Nanoarchaeota archaeon]|nr:hypothetical protein [Nanoarchaeota archaeon]
LKKYGVGNTFQSEEKKNKIKETMINRYGVDNPMKNENIKNKSKNTCLEKYGVEHIVNSKVYRESRKKRIIKKYKKYGIKYIKNDIYVCHCDNCNKMYKIKNRILLGRIRMKSVICTLCNPVGSSHGYENQLYEFIKENYNKDIIRNERKILNNKLELDIYIPELKLSFEFNGVYWHNELNKENNYHHEKTELCERKGIRLIHIYEDDWIYKHDIVKSMILNKLGKSNNKIYARKTELKEITDNKIVRYFLDKNHIQGFIGSKVKLGLFYNNELVSLMTFGKRRVAMGKKKSEEGEYELLRFCSKLNTNVVGGADKLFKYFVRNYSPKEITTYADRSWSQGNLYYNLGFSFKGKTKPNYYYVVGDVRHHRFNYRKDVLVKEGYDPNKTEHQIMIDRGIYRIYDSGNLRFVY